MKRRTLDPAVGHRDNGTNDLVLGTGRRVAGSVLLGCLQVMLIFTLTAISVPLPRIGREFGLDRSGLVLLTASYGLAFAGLLLFGGRLTDRYGGRRMLAVGLTLFGATTVLVPFAPDYELLVGLRFGQGAAAALLAPAALAALRMLLPPPEYHRAMAGWGVLSVLGATSGNLLSGAVSAYLSWRWIFAIPVAIVLAALLLAPRLLPADPPQQRAIPLDLPGAVLVTAGVTLGSYGLVETGAYGWASPAVVVPLIGGIALLAAFLAWERRTREPLLPLEFLLDRRRDLGLVGVALTAASSGLVFFLLPLGLQQERGWSPLHTSGAFVPYALALIAASVGARRLLARSGAHVVTAAGLLIAAAGLIDLAAGGVRAPYLAVLLPGLVLFPIGAALSFAGSAVLALADTPQQYTGLAGGVLNTAMELGPTAGLAMLLTLGGTARPLAVAGGVLAVAAATALRLRNRRS